MSKISQLDDASSTLAAYALYSHSNHLERVVLINSANFPNTTTTSRPATNVTLKGLDKLHNEHTVTLKRLTSQYATDVQELGQRPTFAGRSFDDMTCDTAGVEEIETVQVRNGCACIHVQDSEAVIVYLNHQK